MELGVIISNHHSMWHHVMNVCDDSNIYMCNINKRPKLTQYPEFALMYGFISVGRGN